VPLDDARRHPEDRVWVELVCASHALRLETHALPRPRRSSPEPPPDRVSGVRRCTPGIDENEELWLLAGSSEAACHLERNAGTEREATERDRLRQPLACEALDVVRCEPAHGRHAGEGHTAELHCVKRSVRVQRSRKRPEVQDASRTTVHADERDARSSRFEGDDRA
jgi:hypothetical protein